MIKYLLSVNTAVNRLCGVLMALVILPIQMNGAFSTFQLSSARHSTIVLADSTARTPAVSSASFTVESIALADSTPPVINVWYGANQSFNLGAPQSWINILGGVADPESGISALSYTFNGSAYRALSIGPDYRRLVQPGDFNIDISLSDSALRSGGNTVTIRAVNGAGLSVQSSVQFSYTAGKTWSIPYGVHWDSVSNIQQAVQVVDGRWQIVPGGVRSVETGYDRVIAIGDLGWTDFEVLVPVTINAIDTSKYGDPIGIDPGLGINLRWTGHTDNPVQCGQPKCGWEPTGASVWYEFFSDSSLNYFSLQAYPPYDTPSTPMQFVPGGTYWIRAHVETNSSGSLYKAKAWADGSPEPGWMFTKQTDQSNLDHGSLLLVAHYVDVTFGNISVAPLSAKMHQQITVTQHAPAAAVYGSSFTVAATATSGLPVIYSSGSPSVCNNANGGGAFTSTAAGTCVVLYNQPGSASYSPAAQVKETTTIQKMSQTVSVSPIADKRFGDADFSISASASSGLPVHFQAAGLCAVSGNQVSITGAGSCTITASQPGSAIYAPAQDVPTTFTIAKANQTINIISRSPDRLGPGSSFTITAASSVPGLEVMYTSGNPSVCTNQGPLFTTTGQAGSCIVILEQPGNENYNPAPQISQVVRIEAPFFLPFVQHP